jgi:hypothetical protein
MAFDATTLSPQKRELLKTLIAAGEQVHEAYLHQYSRAGVAVRDSLAQLRDEASNSVLRLIVRNGGVFDKIDGYRNFFNEDARKPGAEFYPADLTKEEFEAYTKAHPSKAESLQSPYTVVKRDGKELVAVPFHKEYERWIVPAAKLLQKASELADNPSLRSYLAGKAQALLTDNYFESHVQWIELDSDIDVLMSPDEVYDDALMGLKASYEVSVMVRDETESKKLAVYTNHINALEQHLPHDAKYKRTIRSLVSPMVIVRDIFRGGDIATGYQPAAATLPNEPAVQSTKGTKKLFWKNMMDARVNEIILPIARELIASEQIRYVTADGVFNDVLMHELCHALGPIFVHGNDSVAVNRALKEHYTAIEELKADVAGLHSLRYFVENGIIAMEMQPVQYVSALAAMFRTIRFGTTEAHGKAALCELNYFLDKGAVRFDANTDKWSVVLEKMPQAISDLAREVLTIEATGDYQGAVALLDKWGHVPLSVSESLRRLEHVPVDIEPVYVTRWE